MANTYKNIANMLPTIRQYMLGHVENVKNGNGIITLGDFQEAFTQLETMINDRLRNSFNSRVSITLSNTQTQNSNGVAQQNIQGESKLHKGKVRLTESQLHNVIKESIRRILKEQNQPIARDFLDYELKESFFADETGDTYWGGLSHNGETLQDFIDSLSDSGLTYDTPMSEINKALRECNIKPIKY